MVKDGENKILESMDLSAIEGFNDMDTILGNPDHSILQKGFGKQIKAGVPSNLNFGEAPQGKGPQYGHSNLSKQAPAGKQAQSVIQQYRHKGLNSLYHLQPKSQSIYLLDFKRQSFIKEKINSQTFLPTCFSSIQTSSGKIFIVGGLFKDLILKSVFRIDENLQYYEMMVMKTGRFCAPIALVNDRYVVTAGGQISIANKGNYYTNASEVYDTNANVWVSTGNLQKARGNTSMTSIGNYVFIFHGLLQQVQPQVGTTIEYINLGNCS